MALLTLHDIGKIYVSEGSVAVGIRGVNLSFERGEFVAVTGKSGSGKSTLLNVISGMDSYEEGELYIEGQSTSHYLQPEWEDYRQKYISFIFQDYNIIESFTVLQNVELALMHIEDPKERRRRALELLHRVGLSSHVRQKGSKLSGGQKQRTVIARALAKDSPIILADEPTGNLDSATSAEIIALLREVSRDKLLIMVTHNFEQVEACATRHIRIFDGAVESDHIITGAAEPICEKAAGRGEKSPVRPVQTIKNGLALGGTIFTAKPRLTTFLCLLMIIGTLGVFLITALCGSAGELFAPNYMFEHIDGRVVVVHRDGTPLSDAELSALKTEYGAESVLHYDALLDEGYYYHTFFGEGNDRRSVSFFCTYGEDYGDDVVGRYPEAANEVLLYLPISYQPLLGKDSLLVENMLLMSTPWRITGVKYYYDNNLTPRCLFTEEGFGIATAMHYLQSSNTGIDVTVATDTQQMNWSFYSFHISFDLEPGKIYITDSDFQKAIKGEVSDVTAELLAKYVKYNYYYDDTNGNSAFTFQKTFEGEDVKKSFSFDPALYGTYSTEILISAGTVTEIAEAVLAESYRQASLFFADDKAAEEAAAKLCDAGYIAVPSFTEHTPDAATAIVSIVASIALAVVWLLAIVFLAFFINLCSGRALDAFKSDMAIMRSMGIPVRVVRVGMYVRMLLCLIPAYLLVAATAILIFTSPKFNQYFVYLYAWQYVLIALGMLLLTLRTTHKQIGRLFGESVKKSLKGGETE